MGAVAWAYGQRLVSHPRSSNLLVGYVFAIRSERQLCSRVQVNLAYRWFCGLKRYRKSKPRKKETALRRSFRNSFAVLSSDRNNSVFSLPAPPCQNGCARKYQSRQSSTGNRAWDRGGRLNLAEYTARELSEGGIGKRPLLREEKCAAIKHCVSKRQCKQPGVYEWISLRVCKLAEKSTRGRVEGSDRAVTMIADQKRITELSEGGGSQRHSPWRIEVVVSY